MVNQIVSNSDHTPWLLPRYGKVSGMRRGVEIREGFALSMADYTCSKTGDYKYEGGGFLKIHCKLAGDSAVSGENEEFVPVEAGSLCLVVQPKDSFKRERLFADKQERAVTLVCNQDFASSILPISSNALPGSIEEFLRSRVSQFSFASVPLPPQIRTVVEDILHPSLSGTLNDLMLEAKALELLCLSINQILNVPAAGHRVRARDYQKVRDLCAILEDHAGSNLSIGELCKLLAWNETQMMECFKQVTGTTISNYRHRVRMDHARRQLHETDASITEIAFNAGYEHPSNFATAFKRTFGFPPRMARTQLN